MYESLRKRNEIGLFLKRVMPPSNWVGPLLSATSKVTRSRWKKSTGARKVSSSIVTILGKNEGSGGTFWCILGLARILHDQTIIRSGLRGTSLIMLI